jgi:hypothetical protein
MKGPTAFLDTAFPNQSWAFELAMCDSETLGSCRRKITLTLTVVLDEFTTWMFPRTRELQCELAHLDILLEPL